MKTGGKVWARAGLRAIEPLIKEYSSKEARAEFKTTKSLSHPSMSCPLCVRFAKHEDIAKDCSACPWVVFTGDDCLQNDYGRHSMTKRLHRLRVSWPNKFNKIIAGENIKLYIF